MSDSLFYWSVYSAEVKCDLTSTATIVQNNLVVFDPAPLAEEAWRELTVAAPLRAIVLTNANHARDAAQLRQRYKVPVVVTGATRRDLTEIKPDVVLLETELLYGIQPIPSPGAGPGETAFYLPNRTLVLGEAVLNLSTEKGLELLPEKYCTDAQQNIASLRQLLTLDFNTLTFAHGQPLVTEAKNKLRALLETHSS